jgi:hypothetical protein
VYLVALALAALAGKPATAVVLVPAADIEPAG